MKVQSVVLMLSCMEDERVYRALVRLYSDGADYAGQTSKRSHRVVVSSKKKKEEAHHSNINPLGDTRIRSTQLCVPTL